MFYHEKNVVKNRIAENKHLPIDKSVMSWKQPCEKSLYINIHIGILCVSSLRAILLIVRESQRNIENSNKWG